MALALGRVTYTSYLRLDELLNIQTPKSSGPDGAEPDEMLFIIIHQVHALLSRFMDHPFSLVTPGEMLYDYTN